MNICTGYLHVVCQPRFFVNADMRLIAKVPGVSLLNLMGIWVPLRLSVFGGRWCRYDGEVHDRSLFEHQAPVGQKLYDVNADLKL